MQLYKTTANNTSTTRIDKTRNTQHIQHYKQISNKTAKTNTKQRHSHTINNKHENPEHEHSQQTHNTYTNIHIQNKQTITTHDNKTNERKLKLQQNINATIQHTTITPHNNKHHNIKRKQQHQHKTTNKQ